MMAKMASSIKVQSTILLLVVTVTVLQQITLTVTTPCNDIGIDITVPPNAAENISSDNYTLFVEEHSTVLIPCQYDTIYPEILPFWQLKYSNGERKAMSVTRLPPRHRYNKNPAGIIIEGVIIDFNNTEYECCFNSMGKTCQSKSALLAIRRQRANHAPEVKKVISLLLSCITLSLCLTLF